MLIDYLGFSITLISFCIAMLVAHFIFKHKSFHFLAGRQGRHTSLDGLRGFLAISVLFHHFIITWYWKTDGKWTSPPEDYFENYGKVGIALFFMISGFLFISKLIHANEKINWFKLYESRLFRILPLYIFVLFLITLVVFSKSNYELNVSFLDIIKQYFYWGIFLGRDINNFPNTDLIIAGVDWTLRYEWLFYASLPLLSIIFIKLGKIGGLILFISCVLLFIKPLDLSPFQPSLLIFFAFGGLAAFTNKKIQIPSATIKGKLVSSVVGFMIISSLFYPNTFDTIHVIFIFIIFILIVLGNDLFGILSLKSSILLGEISYSIYLLHGVILYLSFTTFGFAKISNYTLQEYIVFMPLISASVVIFSSLTFVLIERPGILLGRKYYLSGILSQNKESSNKKAYINR